VIALLQTLHTNTKQRLRVAYMNYNFLGTPARAKINRFEAIVLL